MTGKRRRDCRNCRHAKPAGGWLYRLIARLTGAGPVLCCTRIEPTDAYGRPFHFLCETERGVLGECGPEGRYWEARKR